MYVLRFGPRDIRFPLAKRSLHGRDGVDAHKRTRTLAVVDEVGRGLANRTTLRKQPSMTAGRPAWPEQASRVGPASRIHAAPSLKRLFSCLGLRVA